MKAMPLQLTEGTDHAKQEAALPPEVHLVFLHGWGMNSGAWQSLLPFLPLHIKVLCLDMPGYGKAVDVYLPEYTLAAIAAYISQQLPPNSVLVGWSMGGLVAQYLAIQHDPNVRALITIASTPKFQQDEHWAGIKASVLGLFSKQLDLEYQQTLSRFLAIQMLGMPNAKTLIKAISQAISAFPAPQHEALHEGLTLLKTVDLRAQIKNIEVPTLRLYGRLDSLIPAHAIEGIQALQVNAAHKIYEHVSHAPFISHPEWVADDLVAFVKSLP